MLLCIRGRVLESLEYLSKHGRLHQGLDYIIYSIAYSYGPPHMAEQK